MNILDFETDARCVSIRLHALNKHVVAVDFPNDRFNWYFEQTGPSQWSLCDGENKRQASIDTRKLFSSVYWHVSARKLYLTRTVTPLYDELTYRLGPRAKLRWDRASKSVRLIDGALVYSVSAELAHIRTNPLDAHLKVYRDDQYLPDIIATAFIVLLLWSKKDYLAELRSSLDGKFCGVWKTLWKRILVASHNKGKYILPKC